MAILWVGSLPLRHGDLNARYTDVNGFDDTVLKRRSCNCNEVPFMRLSQDLGRAVRCSLSSTPEWLTDGMRRDLRLILIGSRL